MLPTYNPKMSRAVKCRWSYESCKDRRSSRRSSRQTPQSRRPSVGVNVTEKKPTEISALLLLGLHKKHSPKKSAYLSSTDSITCLYQAAFLKPKQKILVCSKEGGSPPDHGESEDEDKKSLVSIAIFPNNEDLSSKDAVKLQVPLLQRHVGCDPIVQDEEQVRPHDESWSNRHIIRTAVHYTYPQGVNDECIRDVLYEMEVNSKHFVILFWNDQFRFRALYTYIPVKGLIMRVYGKGPNELRTAMISKCYKFDYISKTFYELEANTELSIFVDAITITSQEQAGKETGSPQYLSIRDSEEDVTENYSAIKMNTVSSGDDTFVQDLKQLIVLVQKSNRRQVSSAVSLCNLPPNAKNWVRADMLNELHCSEAEHFILLLRHAQFEVHAIYTYKRGKDELFLMYGDGPNVLQNHMIQTFYKYNLCTNTFYETISNKEFSIFVDAVALKDIFYEVTRSKVVLSTTAEPNAPVHMTNRTAIIDAVIQLYNINLINNVEKIKLLSDVHKSDSYNFILLFRDDLQQFESIYTYDPKKDEASFLTGDSTGLFPVLYTVMIEKFHKYDTTSRMFLEINTNNEFSKLVDAVVVRDYYWDRSSLDLSSGDGEVLYCRDSNYNIVAKVICHSLTGLMNKDEKLHALQALYQANDATHFIILFRNASFQFDSIYKYDMQTNEVQIVHGHGPAILHDRMIQTFYRYNRRSKCFVKVESNKELSLFIDAVILKDVYWDYHFLTGLKRIAKSNRHIMDMVISHCWLGGTINNEIKKHIQCNLELSTSDNFVILFRNAPYQFRAIYTYHPINQKVIKLYGCGPHLMHKDMVDKLYKYNYHSKVFYEIDSIDHMSVMIDAVTIKKEYWRKKALNVCPPPVDILAKSTQKLGRPVNPFKHRYSLRNFPYSKALTLCDQSIVEPCQHTGDNVNVIGYYMKNAKIKNLILKELRQSTPRHFIILFRSERHDFRAIYTYDTKLDDVHKLCGIGPKIIYNDMIDKFYKYNSNSQSFSEIMSTSHLSVFINGITIKGKYWQRQKQSHTAQTDMPLTIKEESEAELAALGDIRTDVTSEICESDLDPCTVNTDIVMMKLQPLPSERSECSSAMHEGDLIPITTPTVQFVYPIQHISPLRLLTPSKTPSRNPFGSNEKLPKIETSVKIIGKRKGRSKSDFAIKSPSGKQRLKLLSLDLTNTPDYPILPAIEEKKGAVSDQEQTDSTPDIFRPLPTVSDSETEKSKVSDTLKSLQKVVVLPDLKAKITIHESKFPGQASISSERKRKRVSTAAMKTMMKKANALASQTATFKNVDKLPTKSRTPTHVIRAENEQRLKGVIEAKQVTLNARSFSIGLIPWGVPKRSPSPKRNILTNKRVPFNPKLLSTIPPSRKPHWQIVQYRNPKS